MADGVSQHLDLHRERGGRARVSHEYVTDARGVYSAQLLAGEAVGEVDRWAAVVRGGADKEDAAVSPLFLYVAFTTIHTPVQVPSRFVEANSHVQGEFARRNAGMMTATDEGFGEIVKASRLRPFRCHIAAKSLQRRCHYVADALLRGGRRAGSTAQRHVGRHRTTAVQRQRRLSYTRRVKPPAAGSEDGTLRGRRTLGRLCERRTQRRAGRRGHDVTRYAPRRGRVLSGAPPGPGKPQPLFASLSPVWEARV